MASARRGLGTLAFFLAGLFLLALAPIDGEPLYVPLVLACWTFGAAVEIDARGPLPMPELLARAVGVAIVVLVTGVVSLATAVLADLGLLAGFVVFWLGWLLLARRPLRRLLNPRGRIPIVSAD
jgi:hypothetical protein